MNGSTWGKSYPGGFQEIRGDTFQGGKAEYQYPEKNGWISFDWYNKQGFQLENLILRKHFCLLENIKPSLIHTSNCQTMAPIYAMFYTSTDDGDVAGDTYKILST
ncbi:hypothetical protein DR864_19685 [Runella rosea]|uniref:Uncharacterized protein n=2 Tax=Runella rosea TaxID=2259595 RepID=A0A344TMD3_9BACT|nr:hypothetical protein DR864_19685 [Runella rosea]